MSTYLAPGSNGRTCSVPCSCSSALCPPSASCCARSICCSGTPSWICGTWAACESTWVACGWRVFTRGVTSQSTASAVTHLSLTLLPEVTCVHRHTLPSSHGHSSARCTIHTISRQKPPSALRKTLSPPARNYVRQIPCYSLEYNFKNWPQSVCVDLCYIYIDCNCESSSTGVKHPPCLQQDPSNRFFCDSPPGPTSADSPPVPSCHPAAP